MLPVNFEYPVEIAKDYEEKGRWIVEGYEATSDFDLQEDIITDDAIQASAKDLLENSTVLHNHNANEAIGRVLGSRARKEGLFLKILIWKKYWSMRSPNRCRSTFKSKCKHTP